jgi:GH24 family phage-related lysozyme (muramidase)
MELQMRILAIFVPIFTWLRARLIDDVGRVLAISLSFWMQVAGLLAILGPEVRFRLTGEDYDPYLFGYLGVGFLIAGLAGRVFQQGLSIWREWLRIIAVTLLVIAFAFVLSGHAEAAAGNKSPATEEETLSLAVPYIMKKEGIRLVAYRDIVGVWTICGGITAAAGIRVYPGMTMTMQRCTELMWVKVAEYRSELHRYFTTATISLRLPPTRDTAYTSLAYNVGIVGIGNSTAVRRLNAGDIRGGCEAITWYDKAGGRVVRGLFERRKDEKAMCLIGL